MYNRCNYIVQKKKKRSANCLIFLIKIYTLFLPVCNLDINTALKLECTALQVGTPIVKTSGVVSMDRRDHKLFRDFKNMIHLSVSFAKIVDFKLKIT